jgi:acid phosphatase (class A)
MKKYAEFLNEQEVVNFAIDGIRYGHPTRELHDIENKESAVRNWFVENGVFDQIVKESPLNSSETTKKDLEVLLDKTSKVTPEDLAFARFVDPNLPQAFIDFLESKGYAETMGEYFSIDTQVEPLCFHLKDVINRPRPYQLAYAYGIPLYPVIHTDANSAAYPSGHALTAFVMSEYYARKYPEIGKEIREFGNKVADSREKMGIHFPSDTEVSRMISNVIWENQLLHMNINITQ